MKDFMKIFFAAVLLLTLTTSALPSQFDSKQIARSTKTTGGVDFVYFNGIIYTIYTEGTYNLIFEEYDAEWVKLDIIPCYDSGEGYSPITVQWEDFSPVVLELESEEGETYLLGTETGYAEK